jgi:enterochelin esterase-like enzyme
MKTIRLHPCVLPILLILTLVNAACDPLGNAAQVAAVLPTVTPTARPTHTPIPPTATETSLPPTETPSPTTVGTCGEPSGQIVSDSFVSKAAQGSVAYRVYLPPCYWQTNRRYPYVILLHGSDGDETEWTTQLKVDQLLDSGIAQGILPPMIVVMPNGGDLANTNVFTPGASFESVVMDELTPLIEKTFCTWNSREGRAIGGISRGGFWAFEITLRHPSQFSAVGGHSAFFDENATPPNVNPLNLAKTVKFAPGTQPRFWLDAGKDDYARPELENFAKALSARGIDPGYTMYPLGEHNVTYWASHVSDYLAFYGQTWPHDSTELPSCLQ